MRCWRIAVEEMLEYFFRWGDLSEHCCRNVNNMDKFNRNIKNAEYRSDLVCVGLVSLINFRAKLILK